MSSEAPRPDFHRRTPEEHLASATLWGGIALALTCVLPNSVIDDQLVFAWQLLPELGAAGVLATLSSSLAGVTLLAARRLITSPLNLALTVVVLLATVATWTHLGNAAAEFGMLSLPDSVGQRSPLLLGGLAAASAGSRLITQPGQKQSGRLLLALCALLTVLFFAGPRRGETPIETLFQLFGNLTKLPDVRYLLGHLLFSFVLLLPLVVGGAALLFTIRPPRTLPRVVPFIPSHGLSMFLLLLVFRSLLISLGDTSVIALLGFAAALLAVVDLLAVSLEIIARTIPEQQAATASADSHWRRLPLLSSGTKALLAWALLTLPQAWLARPPSKGVKWELGKSSEQGDQLFGELVTKWNDARVRWTLARDGSAAAEMVRLQAAARELVQAARELDQNVANAIRRLTVQGRDLDLGGLRWDRLISEVNDANQNAKLPYYLDASVSLRPTGEGLARRFDVTGYRITDTKPVFVDEAPFATLYVQTLKDARLNHGLLGFSRDAQPFALVVEDEIRNSSDQLLTLAASESPVCDDAEGGDAALPSALKEACQLLLRTETASGKDALNQVLTKMTERHELQHQIDGPSLPIASSVLERLRGVRELDQLRVNRELSAYLAEMAGEEGRPKLGLFWLLRFGLHGGPGANAQIAALGFDTLAVRTSSNRRLSVEADDIHQRFLELCTLDDSVLRQRARAAWERLFDAPLATIQR